MNALRSLVLATLIASAAAPALAASAPPAPVPPLVFPGVASRTLPNGLRVVVLPQPRLPIVQIQLMVPAGAASESDSQPGLAGLTAELLRQGTSSRSAAQFTSDLERAGAIFAASAGRDDAVLACGAGSSHLSDVLELMSDAVTSPVFGGDDFAAARAAAWTKLSAARSNLSDLADERLAMLALAPSPYAHAPAGDLRGSLARTPLSAVQAFHRDHWRPDRAVLAIAGDVTPDQAFAAAADWFGRWAGHAVPDAPRPAPKPAAGIHVVDVPDARHTEVRVALVGPGLADPSYAALSLAETALEAAGATEGVRVTLAPARDASLLVLASGAANERATETARRMIDALHAFGATPPSGAALDSLRRRAAGRWPLELETLGALVSQWQANAQAGLPDDELAHTSARLLGADPATLGALLRDPPVVLLAGPAARLAEPLAALGPVDVQPLVPREVSNVDTLPAPTVAQRARGRAAVAAALAAHGGAAKLAAVHILVFEGETAVPVGGQDLQGLFSMVRVDPDRYSMATRVLQLETRQLLAGTRAWSLTQSDSTEVVALDSLGVRTLIGALHDDVVHALRDAAAPAGDPAWRGTETNEGRRYDLVDFASPAGGRQRLVIDAETHRVTAIDAGYAGRGQWAERRALSDYRPVDGVLLPFLEERMLGGQRVARFQARRASINKAVDPHLFDAPYVTAHPRPTMR